MVANTAIGIAFNSAMRRERNIAFDASVRSIDESGHLRVSRTIISKASVDPYFGREIPYFEKLGLEPNRIYNLLRDPVELEKAADTFKGKQLLLKHTYVDSKTPEKDLTVGSIGSNIEYADGKLYADLTAWDEEAIGLIDSGKLDELSSSYYYDPDMTPGEFEGKRYDGVIRNIHGNHVALVERGRIGKDAVISDSLPLEMRLNMKLKKGAVQLITARLRKIAQDGMSEGIEEEVIREVVENIEHKPAFDEEKLRALVGDNYGAVVDLIGGNATGSDESPDSPTGGASKPAMDEDKGPKATEERKELEETDKDDRDAKKGDKRSTAADADTIAAAVASRLESKYAARDAVEPLVGRIAMDGFADASAIYAYALKQRGVACDGVNEAGLKALVAMQRDAKPEPRTIAQDSAPRTELTSRFRQA